MAPKKITVDGVGLKLSNDRELVRWLHNKKVQCLIDSDGDEIGGFETLEDGGEYTLGPLQRAQSQGLSEETIAGLELLTKEFIRKKRTIVLSLATGTAKMELLDALALAEKGASWPNRPAALQQARGFSWLKGGEDTEENRTAYMAHLNAALQLPKDYSLADVQADRDLLSVELFRGTEASRKISGTTDVVIAKSQHTQNKAIRNNIEALLELKTPKNLKSMDHTPQTVAEHFAASFLNPKHAVVSVLTDLINSWTFFWFAKEEDCAALYRLCLEDEEAAGLAKYMLESLADASRRDTLPITFVDRLSLEAVIQSTVKDSNKRSRRVFDGSGGGAGSSSPDEESKPSGVGDWHPNSGPYPDAALSSGSGATAHQSNNCAGGGGYLTMDIASTLSLFAPPANRDVANELDLLDMVDESEQYDIVRSFAMKNIVPYMRGGY